MPTTYPLTEAVRNKHKDAVELLLINGANPNNGYLLRSIVYYHDYDEDIIELLIRYGINIDLFYKRHCIEAKKIRIAKILIDHGYDLNNINEYGSGGLSRAITSRSVDMIILILNSGVDPTIRDNYYDCPLNNLVDIWDSDDKALIDLTKSLLHQYKDFINMKYTSSRVTMITKASYHNKIDLINLLLDLGADPTISSDSTYTTALHYAVNNGNRAIITRLLDMGVDPNISDFKGDRPLHYASMTSNIDIVQLLLNTNIIDINAINKQGRTILFNATTIDSFKYLLDYGAAVNIVDKEGKTAMKHIQSQGNKAIAQYIYFGTLKREASINHR